MTKSNGIRDLLAFLVLILQKTRGLNKEFPFSKQEQTFMVGAFSPFADFSGGQCGRTLPCRAVLLLHKSAFEWRYMEGQFQVQEIH